MTVTAIACHVVVCDGCGGNLTLDTEVVVHFDAADDPAIVETARGQGWAVLSGGRHRCPRCR